MLLIHLCATLSEKIVGIGLEGLAVDINRIRPYLCRTLLDLPYIYIYVWFWPYLKIAHILAALTSL